MICLKNNQLKHNSVQNNRTWPIVLLLFITLTYSNAQQMKDSIINDNSFIIKENPLDSYKGTLREGKPYDGYFKKGDRDFFTVDYYEKGIPVYQYSFDLLEILEEGNGPLNLKSTYKDGKIIDGAEYTMYKHGMITKNLKNGILESFSQDIFAIHYYNRVTFTKENDRILISNLQEKDYKIKVFLKNNAWITQLIHQDQILLHREEVKHTATVFPKNSEISLYVKDNIKHGLSFRYDQKNTALFSDTGLNKNILDKLNIPKTKDSKTAFEEIFTSLIETKGFSDEITMEERPLFMGYFDTDDTGMIKDGIRYIEKEDAFVYHIYENGKVTKKEKTTLEDFQKVMNDYFKNR